MSETIGNLRAALQAKQDGDENPLRLYFGLDPVYKCKGCDSTELFNHGLCRKCWEEFVPDYNQYLDSRDNQLA